MRAFLSGNEAVARGCYESGVQFASGYPGTPSTEILENIVQYKTIHAEWAPNEKVAVETATGACLGGARSIATMKHVGLNVAADPLFSASYIGVNAGLVIVSADDPGMHSSQDEQDNRWLARASKIPMLEPSDSQEAKDLTKIALELSEKYDTPVMLRMTTRICHSKTAVQLDDPAQAPRKHYSKNFKKTVLLPSNARVRHEFVEERMKELDKFGNVTTELNRIEMGSKQVGIITDGVAYQYVKEVFPTASVLKLGLTNPFPKQLVWEFSLRVKKLLVIEELDPFLEEQIKALGIEVLGKERLPLQSELNPDIVSEAFRDVLDTGSKEHHVAYDTAMTSFRDRSSTTAEFSRGIPVRPPTLCPGCSHRGMFYVFKKLHLTVLGDIGCYTLGALPPLNAMDTCLCMGAGVSMAYGMERATASKAAEKTIAVIGDSTFVHSGITGLINIVYNQGVTTICILDNHTTAMTGHQPHPATGKTLEGQPTVQLDFVKLCEAVGVKRVRKVNPFNLEETEQILREELASKEPSVIISESPCILNEKIDFAGPFAIEPDKCPKCGVCIQLGCSAIGVENGMPYIDQLLCPGCTLCQQVCKYDAITQTERQN